MLNNNNSGDGKDLDGYFIPKKLFSPQMFHPATMPVTDMRDILNDLASSEDANYFVFGIPAYPSFMHKRNEFYFVKKHIRDLGNVGGLKTRFFTLVDESHSTNKAKHFLDHYIPQLTDPQLFSQMYRDISTSAHYKDCPRKLMIDLDTLWKKMTDAYAAAIFTWFVLLLVMLLASMPNIIEGSQSLA
ncbi:hypothetical protein Q3G72_021936 [Acer saccharum]|nr:hypothetical protein Q3G72_021936 [Acer saccharum]